MLRILTNLTPAYHESKATYEYPDSEMVLQQDTTTPEPDVHVEKKMEAHQEEPHEGEESDGVGDDGDDFFEEGISDGDEFIDKGMKLMPFLFDVWDVDKSGYIDQSELIMGVTREIRKGRLPISHDNIHVINNFMTEVDTDDNGQLDRKEFGCFLLRLASTLRVPLEKVATSFLEDTNEFETRGWDQVPELFKKWDADDSGTISRHELSVAFRKFETRITHAEVMALMDEVDANTDCELDQKEFAAFLARFSLASGVPLVETIELLLQAAEESKDTDLALEGWKMMPMLFSIWDADKSGFIERAELVEGAGRLIEDWGLDISLEDVYEILDEVDMNNDQKLDRRELGLFLSQFAVKGNVTLKEVTYYLMKLHREKQAEVELKGWADMDRLFRMWDLNKDGWIDRQELTIGIDSFRCTGKCNISAREYLQIMKDVDTDDDGVMDPREFSTFLGRFAYAAGISINELTKHLMEESPSKLEESGEMVQSRRTSSWKFLLTWADTRMAEESLETIRQVETDPAVDASSTSMRKLMSAPTRGRMGWFRQH